MNGIYWEVVMLFLLAHFKPINQSENKSCLEDTMI